MLMICCNKIPKELELWLCQPLPTTSKFGLVAESHSNRENLNNYEDEAKE